jgi:HEPN domain-containing protein
MSLDPVKVEDTRIWFQKAQNDICAAELLLTKPLVDEVAFHCQQAVEKCLKGFLFWHGQPFKKTHALNILG